MTNYSVSKFLFQFTETGQTTSEPQLDVRREPAGFTEADLSEESLAHSNDEENSETSASTEESSESEPTHSSSNDDLKNSEQKQHRKKRRPKKKV